MREVARVFGRRPNERSNLVGGGPLGATGLVQAGGKRLGEELDAGELLSEVVVQVLPNSLLRNLG